MARFAGRRNLWPALDISLPAGTKSVNHKLDALLDDSEVFAIENLRVNSETFSDLESRRNTRRIYFSSHTSRNKAALIIVKNLGPDGARAMPIEVSDEGWIERTQSALRAVQVGDLVVAPPWDRPAVSDKTLRVIEIEPSMGFGTGHHASTRLALRALQQYREDVALSNHLLDLGTGSGILAIAAALLGAPSITAIDRDEDALTNARNNIARNGVTTQVKINQADLLEFNVNGADVIAANLTATFFERHSAVISRHLNASGILILSGITADDEPAVRASLETKLSHAGRLIEDEWVALIFRAQPVK